MRRTRGSRSFAALAAVIVAGLAIPAVAQSPCELHLREADSSYQSGRFDAVIRLADACLEGKPTREEKALFNALMAKALLAMDEAEQARATVEELLRTDPGFEPDTIRDPARFVRLVNDVKAASTTIFVSSVSKSAESLREAPGTVIVVTAEQIERRGYKDLEEIFHDLPGFDISRSNGVTYSTLYQRGYRSDLTQRTLLLVDGVEENDLWINAAWISRQYPLSNIDRIEVVYGPASTMYGANAFAGVVNIITKAPEQIIEKGKRFGVHVDVGTGDWGTRWADVTIAGKTETGNVEWSLTARGYESDEWDLSGYPEWDYDLAAYDWSYDIVGWDSYHSRLSVLNGAQAYLDLHPDMPLESPYYTIDRDADGVATAIVLTEAGAARALELDRMGYENLGGLPMQFSDPTNDWAVHGKLKVYDLVIGFQTWRREEGWTPSHQDAFAPGGDNGFIWTPKQDWIYAKYSRPLSKDLSFTFFSRYKRHEIDEPTVGHNFFGYSSTIPVPFSIANLAAGDPSFWGPTYFYSESSQLRTELSFVYTPSEKLDVVSGFELRWSDIQGTYVWGPNPNPAETGAPRWDIPGGNRFRQQDIGLYAQASYRPWDDWKFVLGGRFDNNKVRTTQGYGTVFNPRFGAVYSPGDFTFKLIYSEAFQQVSNFQKYGTEVGNADLDPERVENIELSGAWQINKDFLVDLTAYRADYSDVAQIGRDDEGQAIFQQIGSLEIQGVQSTASYTLGDLILYGNYTYTHPFNIAPVTGAETRIADIATHQVNLGGNITLWEQLDINLRVNWVDEKDSGPDTTVPSRNYPLIDSYTIANTAITWKTPLAGTKVQLGVNNLFDEEYFHPGPRDKDPIYTGISPQPGRFYFLRLIYDY